MRTFASDNCAGVHPEILQAIIAANTGHAIGYGADSWTQEATRLFHEHLGELVEVFFVFGGTGANVVGLAALLRPYEAVICAESAHINVDECGAPERFAGCKLIPLASADGKITPEGIARHLHGIGDPHHVQPRVVSITQATELGTVYTPAELRALAEYAHARGLLLHMDGARIANAAASLGVELRAITTDVGVDLLSFGGAKNGMMYGEALVSFRPETARELPFIRKQAMQLPSKMRYISTQFAALLTHDLWRRSAAHANAMARRLADAVAGIPGVRLTQPVEANAVFAVIPRGAIEPLQQESFFYVWDEASGEVRWMCAWDTTEEDIERFAAAVRRIVNAHNR